MDILYSQSFQLLGVTIISFAIGIFVKYVSRNDQHGAFKKEDMAVGLELCITSLIMLITTTVNNFNKLSNKELDTKQVEIIKETLQVSPWLILLATIFLWGTSTIIRKKGWTDTDHLDKNWGIIFPNFIGLIALILVFIWIKN